MLRKLAAETLGLSDIGKIVPPSDYDKVDADDYLFHEDGEKIFFLIKSKKDEYCFTNLALIHVDGDSAVSTKRMVRRYDYVNHKVSDVFIETAGNIDLDLELKFTLNKSNTYSIDVNKNCLEPLKDIYKALITIAKIQHFEETARANAERCLGAVSSMYKLGTVETEETIIRQYNALLVNFNATVLERYRKRDFSSVFEKYIRA
jgi:Bacterial PH domain/YvbH-like oligomerisation region